MGSGVCGAGIEGAWGGQEGQAQKRGGGKETHVLSTPMSLW